MQQVGVLAVVEGLQKFLGDMRQVNSSINGLRPAGTMLQGVFESLGNAVLGFGAHILRVAEVTIGVLLRDAINAIISSIRDMIGAIIEAGSEFQILQLRLERLNFNTLINSGMEYNEATAESIRLTREQLEWIQKLAATSPYDAQDVANIFTLARSFGFAGGESQRLTKNIMEFAAGMGLGSQEMERIVINFGQLMQQGKLNSQELRDLARGSFVPINDILERMAKNMGISVEELNKMRKEGVTGSAEVMGFMEAFNELVEERFAGASAKMSQTISGATANLKDLFKSIIGFGVVTPILDTIGKLISGIVEAFTGNQERWDALVATAQYLSQVIQGIIGALITHFMPDVNALADGMVEAFRGLAVWIATHQEDIVNFFIGIADVIQNKIIPFIRDQLIPVFMRIVDWVSENGPTIMEFFKTLGEMVGEFITDLLGGRPEGGGDFLTTILGAIKSFMEFVIKNKDQIVKWIEIIWSAVAVWQVVVTVFNVIIGIIGFVIGGFLAFIGTLAAVGSAIMLLFSPIGIIIALLAGLAAGVIATASWIITRWDAIKAATSALWSHLVSVFTNLQRSIATTFSNIVSSISRIDWYGIGTAMIRGIASGISSLGGYLIDVAVRAAQNAYNAVLNLLGIGSPSKLFFDVGESTMLGMAMGIERYTKLATASMVTAMRELSMPAMMAPTAVQSIVAQVAGNTVTNTETKNFNLTVNSGANTEPILQDFEMMNSLAA